MTRSTDIGTIEYNRNMSLAVVLKVPEGLVLAAESRVSYQIPDDQGNNNFITFDNATKLLSFKGHDYIGAVTFGAGNIGARTAYSFLPEFLNQLGEDRLSVSDFTKQMSNFYKTQWDEAMPGADEYVGQPMVFVVGGFDKSSPYGKVMQFSLPKETKPVEAIEDEVFNIIWGGDRTIVDRIFSGIDVRIDKTINSFNLSEARKQTYNSSKINAQLPISTSALALQDGVNFALTLIRTTIELQSLSTGQRTVGGPIDIAVITRENDLQFIQRKKIVGEHMRNGANLTICADNYNLLATLPSKDWRFNISSNNSKPGKKKFERLIKRASQPVPKDTGKPQRGDDYSEKQTRPSKAADTSAKQRGMRG